MDGLFYEESKVNFQNVKLRDISTNGKGLINTFFNDLIINGLYAKNITCYGDEGDSSLILFNSDTVFKKANFSNMNINECTSNGPIIKILGTSNEISINNLNVNNVKSYGPLIDNLSDNVIIIIINNFIIIIKFEFINN